ncbi:uncharacterized protein LOC108043157 [Drosophila rhopaloa]|uniref:BACK domain-containing protein n=2 Tax=Drosophila rhopaloa TaxID=1041015 RepID=A0ABM5HAL7_DRORH|nr:uncharacterized protein LOC108043157 [Drosophila rhopaloa]
MDFFKPFEPLCEEESEEEHTPFNATFQYDILKKFMPHMRFQHMMDDKMVPLSKKLELALDKNIGPHAHVILNDTVYKCLVLVLRIYCRLFTNNLQFNDFVKFPQDAITNESFEMAYAWMTTDGIYCPRNVLLDLLQAAKFLKCSPLAESVFDCLNDHKYFSELDAFACFLDALAKDNLPIADMMLKRVGKAFLVLVGTKEYQDLDVSSLCDLISSNGLNVQSEIEVFYSALVWLLSDYRKRRKYIGRVLSNVRFDMMHPAFLIQWVDNVEDFQRDLADEIRFSLNNAMITQQENFGEILMSNYFEHGERSWIRDPKCPYGKDLDSDGGCEVSTEMFLYYMQFIRKSHKSFLSRVVRVDYPVIEHAVYYEEDDPICEPSAAMPHTDDSEGDFNFTSEPSLFSHDEDTDEEDFDSSDTDDLDEDFGSSDTDESPDDIDVQDIDVQDIAYSILSVSDDTDSQDIASSIWSTSNDEVFTDIDFFSDPEIESDLKTYSFTDSSTDSLTDSSMDSDKESTADTVVESTSNLTVDSVTDPAIDSTLDSAGDSAVDSVGDSSVDSATDSTADLKTESLSSSVTETHDSLKSL